VSLQKIDDVLKRNTTEESIAYGYTLSIWGSGAFLIQFLELTPLSVLAYVFGGVVGFGLLASVVFSDLFGDVSGAGTRDRLIVASMIHIFASFGNVLASYGLVVALKGLMNPVFIFFLIGVHATVTYNLMLVVEELISVRLYRFEQRMEED
jgi:hypothetical protein